MKHMLNTMYVRVTSKAKTQFMITNQYKFLISNIQFIIQVFNMVPSPHTVGFMG